MWMTLSRSFNNSEKQDFSEMQIQTVEDKIERFLERKFIPILLALNDS